MKSPVMYSAALGALLGAVFSGVFWWLIVGGTGTTSLTCATIDPQMTETVEVATAYEPWTVSIGLVVVGALVGSVVGLFVRAASYRGAEAS
ncbi:hypothetical protein [Nocardia goodfellowii]|uniref:Membrane protein n=1 Tax=Nocardia goodfellowii TaxID=882446 RepID=A0ABS4QJ83_9NOCA|nr:hypothetical protein [Nocardia goodfellowii]MBP2191760.1 putative membrane protein [Nocardia goodfellowii]